MLHFILIVLLPAIFLFSCATPPTKKADLPRSDPSEIQGIAIQDSKVEQQVLPEVYGPAPAPAEMGPPQPTQKDVYGPTESPAPSSNSLPQAPVVAPVIATSLPTTVVQIPNIPNVPPSIGETATPANNAPVAPNLPLPVTGGVAPKVCVVLSPGMVRSMAEVAVLDAIKKAGIPIHCVVGSEMGAVVGGMYSFFKGNVNSVQWQLFKLNRQTYLNFPLLSLGTPKSNGRLLHAFFQKIFKNQKIEGLKIPFGLSATNADGSAKLIDRGILTDAVSGSLALADIFDPWELPGEGKVSSGANSMPLPFELAKKLGGNYFIAVDVVGEEDKSDPSRFAVAFNGIRKLIKQQLKEANFVFSVRSVHRVPFEDFTKQGEVLAAGAQDAEASMPALKAEWEKILATGK